jgi:hypothetical protein
MSEAQRPRITRMEHQNKAPIRAVPFNDLFDLITLVFYFFQQR